VLGVYRCCRAKVDYQGSTVIDNQPVQTHFGVRNRIVCHSFVHRESVGLVITIFLVQITQKSKFRIHSPVGDFNVTQRNLESLVCVAWNNLERT